MGVKIDEGVVIVCR